MERKGSLSCGEEEEGGDGRISRRKRGSPRKRTRVRYNENCHDDEEEEGGTGVEEDDEQSGPSTSCYGGTQKNTNNSKCLQL